MSDDGIQTVDLSDSMSDGTKRYERPMDGGSIDAPVYCSHKRGSNWVALLTGPNAARMEREYLSRRGRIIDLTTVRAGDVLEFGGDYTTSGGRREPNREYWRITRIDFDADVVVYERYPTPAKALRAAREAARAASAAAVVDMQTPMPDDDDEPTA